MVHVNSGLALSKGNHGSDGLKDEFDDSFCCYAIVNVRPGFAPEDG